MKTSTELLKDWMSLIGEQKAVIKAMPCKEKTHKQVSIGASGFLI